MVLRTYQRCYQWRYCFIVGSLGNKLYCFIVGSLGDKLCKEININSEHGSIDANFSTDEFKKFDK